MALKVFDLACDVGHVFEGWFASHDDYDAQCERGLLRCPVCDSTSVTRQASAARLNVSGATRAGPEPPSQAPSPPDAAALQAAALRHLRAMLRQTEDVGARFAHEARRIHEGEAPERAIRGTANAQERRALAEDGIAVLAVPDILDDDRLQ